MSLNHHHAGLNISGNKLQLVEVVHKNDGLYLENVDEEWLSQNIKANDPEFISILQNAFNQIILRKSLICRDISITLPFDFFNIAKIPYEPTLIKEDLLSHFKWELSVLFPPASPSDFLVQHIEIDKSELIKKDEALLIATKKSIIKQLHGFATKNNLNLKYVDNAHIACNPFIANDNKDFNKGVYSSFYLDTSTFSVLVTDSGIPVYFNNIPKGKDPSFSITVAKEFSKMKKNGIDTNTISKFYYCGILQNDVAIEEIEREFGIRLNKINPFNSFKMNESSDFTKFHSEGNFAYSPATGIALRMT